MDLVFVLYSKITHLLVRKVYTINSLTYLVELLKFEYH